MRQGAARRLRSRVCDRVCRCAAAHLHPREHLEHTWNRVVLGAALSDERRTVISVRSRDYTACG